MKLITLAINGFIVISSKIVSSTMSAEEIKDKM